MFGTEETRKEGKESVFQKWCGLTDEKSSFYVVNSGTYGGSDPRSISKLSRFQSPQPLKQHEIDAIILDRPRAATEVERPKINFSVEDTVKINDGAFMGLTGQVSMVDPDKGKLKVSVSIFGRQTPVELDFIQVNKD